MSGDAEQEYFADGISEDTITALSKLSQLFVIARNSSFTFKGRNVNVQEVGQSLGVRYVLEGSVRKSGNRVRITAQLIDATTGGHLWAERFDRDLTDIFAVQDDVTQHIVGALALNLTEGDQQRLATEHTDNLEAYDCFLRGREHCGGARRRRTTVRLGNCLQRAIELDPKFAPAYAFLACDARAGLHKPMEHVPVEIAGTSGRGCDDGQWRSMIDILTRIGRWASSICICDGTTWPSARLSSAIALAPNLAEGHKASAMTLHYSGRSEEALALFRSGNGPEPVLSRHWSALPGASDVPVGQVRGCRRILKRRLVRNPDTDVSRVLLAASYGHLGRFDEARSAVAGSVPRQS